MARLLEEDKQSSESMEGVFNCQVVRTLRQAGYGKVFLATATSPPRCQECILFSADSVESLLQEAVFYDHLPDSPYIIRSYGHQTLDDGYLACANLFHHNHLVLCGLKPGFE